ncbi:MAG: ATP-binding protein [Myxococcota bacterium]
MSGLVAGEDNTRGFRRIILLLIWLVIVPTVLLLTMGILMLVFYERIVDVLYGLLAIGLVGMFVTGGVLSLVFLRREAKLSQLQLDFVSKVSHELRTPLTSIRMFVEMLQQDGHDPDETKICLDVLHKETLRLSERIERLLDWGRMEAGRKVYELQPLSPRALVDDAVRQFEASHLGLRPRVEVEVAPDLPDVAADPHAMTDALVNLLSNALKYAGAEAHIALRVTPTARGVRFSVIDDGPGIPTGEHKRVFQKFYRANDLLSREVEGSGLGLAIVRHVATGHGGRVELISEVGQGATFSVLLPFPQLPNSIRGGEDVVTRSPVDGEELTAVP